MFLLANLLLLPVLLFGFLLAYFHFFGGPLSHHYLYLRSYNAPTANKAASGASVAPPSLHDHSHRHRHHRHNHDDEEDHDEEASSHSSSSTHSTTNNIPFRSKNALSPNLNAMLHRFRIFLLGENESTRAMILFRSAQRKVWRVYKGLLRRIVHTGELERMCLDSQIQMIPMGNCMNERVGFHPHLVSLSVRISAYLRNSDQLRSVLALEAENAQSFEVVARAMQTGKSTAPDVGEDETPQSTPALNAYASNTTDLPSLSLGEPSSSSAAASSSLSPSSFSASVSSSTPSSSQFKSFASRVLSLTPPRFRSSATTSFFTPLPPPPALTLASSDSASSSSSAAGAPSHASLVAQDRRANHLLQLIVAIKGVSRTNNETYCSLFRPILYRALVYRNELDDFIRFHLDPILLISYDQKNPVHEQWLQELWELYLPLGPTRSKPSSRITEEWGQLGFQGSNPATDFRGMGILGLRNLMEFARLCPIQSHLIMKHSQEYGLAWFSYAITGINLTADLVRLTKDHTLDAYFFTYGANWASWNALYSTIFIKFDEFWQEEKPPNVMSYSTLHATFLTQFINEALTFPFSPHALADAEFRVQDITPVTPRILARERSGGGGGSGSGRRNQLNQHHDADDEDEEFEIEGATRVTERLVATAASRRSSSGGPTSRSSLSRSQSPYSSSSPYQNSPGFSSLSNSELLDTGSAIPLGNLLDPVVVPSQFERLSPPVDWYAGQQTRPAAAAALQR